MVKAINILSYVCAVACFGMAAIAGFLFHDIVLMTLIGLGGCCGLILARMDAP